MPARLYALGALVSGSLVVCASAASNTLPPGFAPLRVGFDPIYDAPATPMTAVACSDR